MGNDNATHSMPHIMNFLMPHIAYLRNRYNQEISMNLPTSCEVLVYAMYAIVSSYTHVAI